MPDRYCADNINHGNKLQKIIDDRDVISESLSQDGNACRAEKSALNDERTGVPDRDKHRDYYKPDHSTARTHQNEVVTDAVNEIQNIKRNGFYFQQFPRFIQNFGFGIEIHFYRSNGGNPTDNLRRYKKENQRYKIQC